MVREMYSALSKEDKAHWEQKAKEEYTEAVAKWTRDLDASPSTAPADRQRCIQGLVQFIQPILDIVRDSTGWTVSFIAGGPEPAHEGRLNVISVHSGTTGGDVKLNFGQSECVGYKAEILPLFGDFLKKCYSPEECRSRMLTESNSKAAAHHIEDGNVNYDTIDLPIILTSTDSADSARSSIPCISEPVRHVIVPSPTPVNQAEAPTHSTLLAPRMGIATAVDAGPAVRPTPSSVMQPAELPSSGIEPCADAESRPIAWTPAAAPTAQQLADAAIILEQLRESMEDGQDGFRSRLSLVDPWAIQMPHPLSRAPSPIPSPVPSRAASPLPAPASDQLDQTAAPKGRPSQSTTKAKAKPKKKNPRKRAPASDNNPRPKKKGRADTPDDPEIENVTLRALRSTRETISSGAVETPTPAAQRATKTLGAIPSTLSSPTTIECPNNAALWLVNAVSMLSAGDLGAEWLRLVQAWLKFELEQGSNTGSKLNSAQRPTIVADWMKRKRSATWRPLIRNVVAYGTMHTDWWCSLQPSWRLREDGTIDEDVVTGDWAELRKPGVNGILSVLASLFYWGVNAKGRKDAKRWSLAVCDCLHCLQSMA